MEMRSTIIGLVAGGALAAGAPAAQTAYRGTVSLGGNDTEVVVRVDGGSIHIDLPAQGPTGLEATVLEESEAGITFEVPDLPGAPVFVGRWSDERGRLEGSVTGAVTAPPSTDVFLCDLGADAVCAAPVPVTDREGYDNQPFFLPGGEALLYVSERDGQTDVFRYSLADGSRERLTATPESEYSPTPMPGGERFSTVRVEADGTQRLWAFPLAGGEPELLLPEVAPVGYHAWLDGRTMALFVLGEPPTLQVAGLAAGAPAVAAASIGRSLHRWPADGSVAFVSKAAEPWTIATHDPSTGRGGTLGRTVEGAEDFAVGSDGSLWMASGAVLFQASAGDGELEWRERVDLTEHGIDGITRLALSDDGARLALVAARSGDDAPETVEGTFAVERWTAEGEPE